MGAVATLDMALAGVDEGHYAWPPRLCAERGRRAAAAFALGSDLLRADLLTAIGMSSVGSAPEAGYLEESGLGFLLPGGGAGAGALPELEAELATLDAYHRRVASGGDARCTGGAEERVAAHIAAELELYLGCAAGVKDLSRLLERATGARARGQRMMPALY
ncbi:MAG: hypothetical protein ACI36Y_08710 [Coriobacteriales bacterium]